MVSNAVIHNTTVTVWLPYTANANYESGKALLLLKGMHVPRWTYTRAMFLPPKQGFTCFTRVCRFEFHQFFPKTLANPVTATLIHTDFGACCPCSMKWNDTLNAYVTLFCNPNRQLAVIAVTLPFSNDCRKIMCTRHEMMLVHSFV